MTHIGSSNVCVCPKNYHVIEFLSTKTDDFTHPLLCHSNTSLHMMPKRIGMI